MSWLKKLQQEMDSKRAEKVPPGWETSSQIAKKEGLSICHTQKLLAIGIDSGRVEVRKFLLPSPRGLRGINHYRLKKA